MKDHIISLIEASISALQSSQVLPEEIKYKVHIERTKKPEFGDFACNVALMLAKPAGSAPRALAEQLIEHFPESDKVTKVEIAGPGFINFFMAKDSQFDVIKTVLSEKEAYGQTDFGKKKHIHVEFVSANPTGPLHVGHGRGAAIGSALSSVLTQAGYNVHREYYVNDAGRQMDILAVSVWLRYLERLGHEITFPVNGYKGTYVYDIAAQFEQAQGKSFDVDLADLYKNVTPDLKDEVGDKEAHIDGLIHNAKTLLEDRYKTLHAAGLNDVLSDIKVDLGEFSVHYDEWFSENSLFTSGAVEKAISILKEKNLTYLKDGALWFMATDFGDDKDRVLVRDNGQTTYFASDAAYLLNKFDRGAEEVVYLFGADHHGYIPRLYALADAFGIARDKVHFVIVQFAVLYEGGEQVQMSTRSGSFVTLRQLREDVGNDAARFFYAMRKAEQHLDFDLDLAKSQSSDNPVYYVQYAHARICSVFRQLAEAGYTFDIEQGLLNLTTLESEQEQKLTTLLAQFPESINACAAHFEPYRLTYYLRDLANAFHAYYNQSKFIVDDAVVRNTRLTLIKATKQVLANGLKVLGLSAPEKM